MGGDDDLDALELLEVGVPGGRHRPPQRPDEVGRPVGDAGGAEQDLLQGAGGADVDPLAARSAPQATALTMSPDRPMPPSAMTCTYRPPDSSM
jgi:hypothetical protein